MKRLVTPSSWSQMYRSEHPPLMMKQLFQGVCGGLRWLETKEMAEYITKKALEDTSNRRKSNRVSPKNPKRKDPPKKFVSPKREIEKQLDLFRGITSLGDRAGQKRERLVRYDVLDCTLGGGYHSGAVLENGSPYTRVVALDCDPDAAHAARELSEEFGSHRLRFYCSKMSEILSLFGEQSFDAVMIDAGPSRQQLEDPVRGFLLGDENEHSLDMRYGPQWGMSALSYLNTVAQKTLASSLAQYKLLTFEQCTKFARIVRKHRPFRGSIDFLEKVDWVESEASVDSWANQSSRRKAPMPWEFLVSLRCVVNHEAVELEAALRQALLVVRESGRVVIFSRFVWEEDVIQKMLREHPHALLTYSELIEANDKNIKEYEHSRHTKMWVVQRLKQSAAVVRNTAHPLGEAQVRESQLRWMTGLYAGQTHGFPAHNLTFEHMDAKERRVARNNSKPPPFDYDDDWRNM